MNEDKSLKNIFSSLMIETVPSYANKIFYSLGFLSMISFFMLIITGTIMVFEGPDWWLTDPIGVFIRSVHLWSTQAFVLFILLHITIVFLTSGFKGSRKLTWVLGALMFFFALAEAEFGYILRDDFSSQWRSLQASDLYNGSGLGAFINNLNYTQIYGIHIVLIPLIIITLLFFHYLLVKTRGIAKPYKEDFKYKMVPANHTILFIRGASLVIVILILSVFFKSPMLIPITIQSIAQQDPSLTAATLISELNHTSDTATYMDNIDPYTYNTKFIYIDTPYNKYIKTQNSSNMLDVFDSESPATQDSNIKSATDYFSKGNLDTSTNYQNPVIPIISNLVKMAQSGLYEDSLKGISSNGYNPTYVTRFLSDTGVIDTKAQDLGITTDQYGMVREENGSIPPGAWWLTPIGVLDHTALATDDNQDRDGAIIIGVLMLLFIAFPYIPFVNKIPEKLLLYRLIWKDKKLTK